MADNSFNPVEQKKLPEELKDRLYAQFDSLTRNFRVAFGALLLFSLAFFYLIFQPVVSINQTRAELVQQKAIADSSLIHSTRQLALMDTLKIHLNHVSQHLSRIPVFVNKIVEDFTKDSLDLRDRRLSQSVAAPTTLCMLNSEPNLQLQCLVSNAMKKYFAEMIYTHRDSMFATAGKIKGFFGSIDTASFASELDTARMKMEDFISHEVNFNIKDGNIPLLKKLTDLLENPMTHFQRQVNQLKNLRQRQLKIEKLNSDSLSKVLQILEAREKEISGKIEKIEFPVGSLPVSLHESMEFFPILLTIGLLISMYLFISILDLRGRFIRLYLNPLYPSLDREDFAVTLPVWLNPDIGLRRQIFQVIFLLVPLFIFIGTVFLTISSWSDLKTLADINHTEIWTYQEAITVLIYITCSAAYFLTYLKLFKKYRWRMEQDRRR